MEEHRSDPAVGVPSRAGSLPLVGGALALDLCNTTSGLGTDRVLEHIVDATTLLAWCLHAKVFDATAAPALERRLFADTSFGQSLRQHVLALRQSVYAIASAVANGRVPPLDALHAMSRERAESASAATLGYRERSFAWCWDPVRTPDQAILGPIVSSAISVFFERDLSRLKQCAGEGCGWLFLDRTKNNTRRWCEMEVCGNRAKQKRLQLRAALISKAVS